MAEYGVTYDAEARAAYFHLQPGTVATTREVLEDHVWVDLDADGGLVGVEMIGIEEQNLPHFLNYVAALLRQTAEKMDSREAAQLLTLR